MRKFLDTCRRLLSIALNLFVLCVEPIALPLSWEMGQAQIFTFYTEDSNIFAAVVCAMVAVCQLWCIFTGGELPRWLKRLKFMATSCLLLTFLTVVFVLAPMNGEGGLYMLLCTSSMLYHHLLNPMAALLSYLLLEREPHLPRSDVRWALLPTLAYAAVILPLLTEAEHDVYRRGRNSHVNTVPHGATPGQYHAATALEAVFGWLWLRGERERIHELFAHITEDYDAA